MARPSRTDLLQGTLDLLILKTLATGPEHGWGISQRIQQTSEDALRVNQGSLYPALHRLEEKGWVASEWGVSDTNREARFYRLTRSGQRQLQHETEQWQRITAAVMAVYSVIALVVLLGGRPISYAVWKDLFAQGWMRVATLLFAASLAWHAWVGVRDILMDYAKPTGLRLSLQVLVLLVIAGYLGWTIQILWR